MSRRYKDIQDMIYHATNTAVSEKNIRRIFIVTVLLKGLNALLEIVGGILLLFTGVVSGLADFIARGELLEDPTDLVANLVQHYLPYFSEHTQLFVALYLLSHGIIKIFLVIGLLRNKLTAYPAAIIVFTLFIMYQVYSITFTHSIFLILLTLFDCVVIWLTWHEYKIRKTKQYETHIS